MDGFRKATARRLRAEATSAELILWKALRDRRFDGWKFRRQHPIASFIVDFVSLQARLVLEVDGATHGTDQQQSRDASRSDVIESLGFRVVRVTNTDVYENLPGVLEFLAAELALLR